MSYEKYKDYRLAPDDNGCWAVLDRNYEAQGTYPSKAAAKRAIDEMTDTNPCNCIYNDGACSEYEDSQVITDEELKRIVRRFGEAYDGENGLMYPPEQHVEMFANVIKDLLSKAYLKGKQDANYNKVTRFEVIDHTKDGEGRILVKYGVKVEAQLQDDDRTLKVLLNDL